MLFHALFSPHGTIVDSVGFLKSVADEVKSLADLLVRNNGDPLDNIAKGATTIGEVNEAINYAKAELDKAQRHGQHSKEWLFLKKIITELEAAVANPNRKDVAANRENRMNIEQKELVTMAKSLKSIYKLAYANGNYNEVSQKIWQEDEVLIPLKKGINPENQNR